MGTRARQNSLTVGWRLTLAVVVAILAWPNVSAAQGADQRFNTVRITSTADTALCVGSVVGSSDCTGGISLSKINLGHLTDTTITRASAGVIAVEGVNVLLATNIGSTVQAYDADLGAISGLSPSNDDVIQRKAGAWTNRTMTQLAADLTALAGLARNETVNGAWDFTSATPIDFSRRVNVQTDGVINGSFYDAVYTRGWAAIGDDNAYLVAGGYRGSQWAGVKLYGSGSLVATADASGLAWGGGSALSNSDIVARRNAPNTFTAQQNISMATPALVLTATTGTNAAYVQMANGAGGGVIGINDNAAAGFPGAAANAATLYGYSAAGVDILSDYGLRLSSYGANALLFGVSQAATFKGNVTMNVASGTLALRAAGSSQDMTVLWENSAGDDIARIVSNTGVGDLVFYPYPNTTPALTLKATTRAIEVGGNVVLGSYSLSGDGGDEGISVDSSGGATITGGGLTIDSRTTTAMIRMFPDASSLDWRLIADDVSGDFIFSYDGATTFMTFDASGTDIDLDVPIGGSVAASFSSFNIRGGATGCSGTPTTATSGIVTGCASPESFGDWVLGLPSIAGELRAVWDELRLLQHQLRGLPAGKTHR